MNAYDRKRRRAISFQSSAVAISITFSQLLSAGGAARADSVAAPFTFTDVTAEAGVAHQHGWVEERNLLDGLQMIGGVAAGDYDGDGWVDLYALGGTKHPNRLYRNLGNGTFADVAPTAAVGLTEQLGSGPLFADFNGDGMLDLFIGGMNPTMPRLFLGSDSDTSFNEVTDRSGLDSVTVPTVSAAAADYDNDGDVDLLLTHWGAVASPDSQHLWQNDGNAHFTDVSADSRISLTLPQASYRLEANPYDFTITANFADINGDGWQDILLASDFGTSQVLKNNRNGTFKDVTSPVISDENGMGVAIGDYDNDGDLDWFVSSIHHPDGVSYGHYGITGNRLYRNDGKGNFSDATTEAGVREGYWGWGSCFADFDNDGDLDLLQTNGWAHSVYFTDPTRLWTNNGDGTFTEVSQESGLIEDDWGRGVVCFDYDRDGDVDVFVWNNQGTSRLWRNETAVAQPAMVIELAGPPGNHQAIGALVEVQINKGEKPRAFQVRAGSNYASQDPFDVVVGLGRATRVASIVVRWPDGVATRLKQVATAQRVAIQHPYWVRANHGPDADKKK